MYVPDTDWHILVTGSGLVLFFSPLQVLSRSVMYYKTCTFPWNMVVIKLCTVISSLAVFILPFSAI